MKKLLVFSMFCFFMHVACAQDFEYQTKAEVAESEKQLTLDRQKMRDQHITSITIYAFKTDSSENSKSGYLSIEKNYDRNGNLSEFKYFRKNGKIKSHYTYRYDKNEKEIEFTEWKSNGKMFYRYLYTYDSMGNITDQRLTWKKPENVSWHSVYSYDANQNLIELKYLGKNDTKDWGRYVYSYYPDGSKKQTLEYGRKNKVRHTWNYDCNPAGKQEGKNLKDTSQICIRYETDKDGNKLKIKEENRKGGKVTRVISKYDPRNNLVEYEEYNSKGRTKEHYRYVFDGKNNQTEYIRYRGNTNEIINRGVSLYDASDNLKEEIVYKKSSVPVRILKFNYITQLQ